MKTRSMVLGILLAGVLPTGAGAQRPDVGAGPRGVEQAFSRALRERVGLSEEQISRLRAVNQRFEERRRQLLLSERTVREHLRSEMRADTANQQRVAAALDSLLAIQRRRIDLVAEEQQVLAEFMTPVQRARYHALQETVRRGAEEIRRRRMQGPPPGRGRAEPGPR